MIVEAGRTDQARSCGRRARSPQMEVEGRL
jgi:hypothetical protein